MRLAVFTSKYPARVATFFERDMRALIEAGIEIDVFPIYPLDSDMWDYSLDTLSHEVLSRDRIHHIGFGESLRKFRFTSTRNLRRFVRDAIACSSSAVKHGPVPFAKTAYVLPKALAWARDYANDYDHVLAYWGNYAATCAYAFHRLLERPIPFSIWLHAGADLYETPIFLREKLRYADRIITCCAFNRKFLSEHYPEIFPEISDKINVCYHGLNFDEFQYELEDRPTGKIVCVGRLSREKGFDYLLRAGRELIARGRKLEIQFVGDGEEASALKSLAQELGISDDVNFRGWLKFDAVKCAMREATVLVHPSDGLGDGLPNVIREAMALGTPVIASDIAGIHEALDDGKCGLLVEPRNVTALVHAIETLMSNAELRRNFADAARRRSVEKFDMWRNGQHLAQILRETRRLSQFNSSLQLKQDVAGEIRTGLGDTV